jgi:hypothetical protein
MPIDPESMERIKYLENEIEVLKKQKDVLFIFVSSLSDALNVNNLRNNSPEKIMKNLEEMQQQALDTYKRMMPNL